MEPHSHVGNACLASRALWGTATSRALQTVQTHQIVIACIDRHALQLLVGHHKRVVHAPVHTSLQIR
eukprot:COSAG06_NODE_55534_length_289_cov_0.768421_1_plen_66_part_10